MSDRYDERLRAGCPRDEHTLHRRLFLEGAAGAGALSVMSWSGLFSLPAFAEEAKRRRKHCILLWLCGAPSQFETWDPKPESCYGGPFGSIETRLPGVRFSALMPQCATLADKLAVVRSMKTKPNEHFQGIDLLNRGAPPRPPFVRPTLGSVLAQQLGQLDSPIPGFVLLDPCPEGNEFKAFKAGNWAGWLGAEYGPVRAGGEFKIPDVERLPDITAEDHEDREALRRFLTRKFQNERQSAAAASQNAAFARVKGLMSCAAPVRRRTAARGGSAALWPRRVRSAGVVGPSPGGERSAVRHGRQRHELGLSRLPARDSIRCSFRKSTTSSFNC